jgi:hypothetical protein
MELLASILVSAPLQFQFIGVPTWGIVCRFLLSDGGCTTPNVLVLSLAV